MERIVRGRSATLYKTFYADGVAADPTGTPTVTVTRLSDGSTVTTGAVTNEVAAGTWSVTLPSTSNLLLDTLTVDWSATVGGDPQEYLDVVEVAGGTFFTLAEARAVTPLNDETKYTDAAIVAMRTLVEDEMEQACGVAFVPRFTQQTVDGGGGRSLLLRPTTTAVRSVALDGTAYTVDELSALSMSTAGSVYSASRVWAEGYSNYLVGFEHGYREPPPGVKRAALLLAKMWLVGQRSPIDDRAATFANAEGGTYSLVVPGRNGSTFGHPDVDSVVDRYSLHTGIA